MHAGRSSQSGLYGALLAEGGFTGIADVFESEYGGFCTTFSRSQDRFKLAELTAGVGSGWQTIGGPLEVFFLVGRNYTTLRAPREMGPGPGVGGEEVEKIHRAPPPGEVRYARW